MVQTTNNNDALTRAGGTGNSKHRRRGNDNERTTGEIAS